MTQLEAIAKRTVPCDRCGAIPGAGCKTACRARATRPHQARLTAVEAAWRAGHGDGIRFALNQIRWRLDPDRAHADIYADIEKVIELLEKW